MGKWNSKKLFAFIATGAVVVLRPEIALYATILGGVFMICQAYQDKKK